MQMPGRAAEEQAAGSAPQCEVSEATESFVGVAMRRAERCVTGSLLGTHLFPFVIVTAEQQRLCKLQSFTKLT